MPETEKLKLTLDILREEYEREYNRFKFLNSKAFNYFGLLSAAIAIYSSIILYIFNLANLPFYIELLFLFSVLSFLLSLHYSLKVIRESSFTVMQTYYKKEDTLTGEKVIGQKYEDFIKSLILEFSESIQKNRIKNNLAIDIEDKAMLWMRIGIILIFISFALLSIFIG